MKYAGRSEMRTLLSLGVVFGLLCGPAFAQSLAEKMACQSDFKKYCNGVEPGGGRIIACLSKHEDKLSGECKKVVEAHKH